MLLAGGWAGGCPYIAGGPDLSNVDRDRADGGEERLTEIEVDTSTSASEAPSDTADTATVLPWDWCAEATLEGDPGHAEGTTEGAADTFTPSCAPSLAPDVALAFVAPASASYRFTTDAPFNPVLAVLDGCGGTELACNDDASPGNLQSRVVVDLAEGQAVIVMVDGFGAASGPFAVEVRQIPVEDCGNHIDDDFDGLIDCFDPDCALDPICNPVCPEDTLQGVPGVLIGNTTGMTDDTAPPCVPNSTASDVSVAFTAPADGSYVFDTVGSRFDTVLYAMDGCGGPPLGCNDDWFGLQSRLVIVLAAGQTAILVVDGFAQESGEFSLQVGSEQDCADGIDDDGDGDVDCFDLDCADDPDCAPY